MKAGTVPIAPYMRMPLLVLFVMLFSAELQAQVSQIKSVFLKAKNEHKEVLVILVNDDTFTGEVLSVDEESAAVETENGIFNIRYDRIKTVQPVEEKDVTTRWFKNIAANKLFITQSGRMQEAGTGYYQNTWLFFSTFSYGVSPNITLSANFSMLPGAAVARQLYFLTAKGGVNVSRNLSVSGTLSYYTFPILGTGNGVTTLFGNATYSWHRLDLTGGIGTALNSEPFRSIIFIAGGQYRAAEKFALVTENIRLPDGNGGNEQLLSLGGRFLSRTISADLGFVTTQDFDEVYPLVSFTVKL